MSGGMEGVRVRAVEKAVDDRRQCPLGAVPPSEPIVDNIFRVEAVAGPRSPLVGGEGRPPAGNGALLYGADGNIRDGTERAW